MSRTKLIELKAINEHLTKWAKLPWDSTTKMVIMSLLTKRRKIIANEVRY